MKMFAARLTHDATPISKDDHVRLRTARFDDCAILQITLIAAWFNYINRVADALGWEETTKRVTVHSFGRFGLAPSTTEDEINVFPAIASLIAVRKSEAMRRFNT